MSEIDGGSGWASGPGWDLHCGRWQSALSHVGQVDALIVDAPYSERTHAGHNSGVAQTNGPVQSIERKRGQRGKLTYAAWTPADVEAFVSSWSPRVAGWMVSITDDVLAPVWKASMETSGRYAFAPLPWVSLNSRVRLVGDGPSSWTCWIVVGRPRSRGMAQWGTLPGAYVDHFECAAELRASPIRGSKPLGLMRALVRDYTRPGDLVCDPCAGGSTTLLAALMEGRRAVGAEMDPAHFEIARKRLGRGFTPPLFTDQPADTLEQASLFDTAEGE